MGFNSRNIKKYREFFIVLGILVLSIIFGLIVLVKAIQTDGDIFGKYSTEEIVADTGTQVTGTSTEKKKKTSTTTDSAYEDLTVGTIFIGDSRFVGMNDVVDVEGDKERQWLIAKVSQGLSWFNDSALSSIEKIRDKNTAISTWRYVVNLGVNDLRNIDNYIEAYEELTESDSSIQLIVVSVNPVYEYETIDNSQIQSFNKQMKAACEENGWDYIDTYSDLISYGYSTQDGLHYTKSTYTDIYEYILEGLAEISGETEEE